MDNTNAANQIIKVLQDGLIFRRATESDEENIEILSQLVHSGPLGMEEEDGFSFFKKYAKGPHPPTTIEHFVVIENTKSNPGANPIVAVTCLVKELCMYGSVPFVMGRPEIIGTHPDFRGRGFVHLMMEYINNLCDKENLLLEGITGIPFFYRQFGYEYALALDDGDGVKLDDIPPLDENNQYFLRSAQLQDYDDYSAFHDLSCTTSLISISVNPDIWNHALTCWKDNEKVMRTYIIYMIYSKSFPETPVGVAVVMYNRWTHCQTITEIVLGSLETNTMYPASKVEEMLPDILSTLKHNLSKDLIPQRDKEPPLSMLKLNITKRNPIHSALMNLKLYSTPSSPYAWYIRIPDIPMFVRHISKELDQRLSDAVSKNLIEGIGNGCVCVRIFGSVHPSRFIDLMDEKAHKPPTQSFKISIENNKILSVEAWKFSLNGKGEIAGGEVAHISLPWQCFFKVLLGYCSIDELIPIFPDISFSLPETPDIIDGKRMLNVLFPKIDSCASTISH